MSKSVIRIYLTPVYQTGDTVSAGQYTNLGIVSAEGAVSGQVQAYDPANYFGALASIDLHKFTNGDRAAEPNGPIVPIGDLVTFDYVLTNDGNEPLKIVSLIDDHATPDDTSDDFSPFLTDLGDGDTTLDIGETWTFSIQRPATAGLHANTATVEFSGAGFVGTHSTTSLSHHFGGYPIPTLSILASMFLVLFSLLAGLFGYRKIKSNK